MGTHWLSRAIHRLRRSPLFTSVAIATLTIGIGANAAMFSVVNTVLLRPLPFAEADRLVGVWHTAPGLGFDLMNQAPSTYFTYRDEGRVFEDIGMWDTASVSVTGVGEPERVSALMVSDGTLPILRVQPVLGRHFTAEEDGPAGPERVLLGYVYWQRKFGGDATAVGKVLTIEGRPREIIGVLPQGFQFLSSTPAVVLPFRFDRSKIFVGNFSYQAVARLEPGVTIEQAGAVGELSSSSPCSESRSHERIER